MTRNVMQTAWTIAHQGAARFGGSARSYIAAALRMVWRGETSAALDRKSIARELDRMAARAGSFAASAKQVWFLAGLMAERGEDARNLFGLNYGNMTLTGKTASFHIDLYLRDARRAA